MSSKIQSQLRLHEDAPIRLCPAFQPIRGNYFFLTRVGLSDLLSGNKERKLPSNMQVFSAPTVNQSDLYAQFVGGVYFKNASYGSISGVHLKLQVTTAGLLIPQIDWLGAIMDPDDRSDYVLELDIEFVLRPT